MDAGNYPSRKSSLFLAGQWKEQFGYDNYQNFKVSKGWCDKFMKRNKVQLKKWAAALDRVRFGPLIID